MHLITNSLKTLDLSWNELRLSELELLIHTIGGVNHIQYLSLAAIPISGPNIPRMISDITNVIVSLYNFSPVEEMIGALGSQWMQLR